MQCRAIIRAVGAMDIQQTYCVIVSDAAGVLVCCYACGFLQLVRMLSMGKAGGATGCGSGASAQLMAHGLATTCRLAFTGLRNQAAPQMTWMVLIPSMAYYCSTASHFAAKWHCCGLMVLMVPSQPLEPLWRGRGTLWLAALWCQ
jgi:hypothetical protein